MPGKTVFHRTLRDLWVWNTSLLWALKEPTGEPFEIAPIRALLNAYQLLGGEAFARMLSLLAGAWQGTPNSLKASMLSGMALFVKTYETELSDRAFIRRTTLRREVWNRL